ncbi:hypothetical protein M436DRAFT_78091 [Aureobasidium namibiae CBS 147.97]|uniref:Uncharacterized protein n=1 Tax=Aureobasidium namibiae CBS 147.97 TaxID=1043004 RepID=A0A074X8A2_9PEZI
MPSINRPINYFQESGQCYEDDDTDSDCSCSDCEAENDDSEVILSDFPTPTPIPGLYFSCPLCEHRMIFWDTYWFCAVCLIERGNWVWADGQELADYYNRGR